MAEPAIPALPPGSTIGILGGGQLGRMLALAAARLGLECHIYAPEADSCAFDVVRHATLAEYDDEPALERFARACDVITYEFENVPAATANFLARRKPVRPDPQVLALTQDRLVEKDFIAALSIATAPYAAVDSGGNIAEAVAKIGLPAVLKTRRLGYDGKGQRMIGRDDDPAEAFRSLGSVPCILEGFVPFEREISVVAARSSQGEVVAFDVTENEHRHHILKISRAPARISDVMAEEAQHMAETIASAFGYVGVLAVEMFALANGAGRRVLVNEIAPRVHNSGHWTIDGASVSQFEQHIRAVAGWPLGHPVRHGRVEMTNLIGAEVNDYPRWLTEPGTSVHLYGKGEPRPGRKMGHVTRVFGEG
ncbi:MAG: 5-(carboxyamino)imidazole ribonucleotide synthase [Pseudorhodoplanes sp.]|nr:5-(carboxyamino)imidazole ribonucleotide synthase [Pseudorhodoplanes sp.]